MIKESTRRSIRFGIKHKYSGLYVWAKTYGSKDPVELRVSGTYNCLYSRIQLGRKGMVTLPNNSGLFVVSSTVASSYKMDKCKNVILVDTREVDGILCKIYQIPRSDFYYDEITHCSRELVDYETRRTGLVLRTYANKGTRSKYIEVVEGDTLLLRRDVNKSSDGIVGNVVYKNCAYYIVGHEIDKPLCSIDTSLLSVVIASHRPPDLRTPIQDGKLTGCKSYD